MFEESYEYIDLDRDLGVNDLGEALDSALYITGTNEAKIMLSVEENKYLEPKVLELAELEESEEFCWLNFYHYGDNIEKDRRIDHIINLDEVEVKKIINKHLLEYAKLKNG